MAEIIQIFKKLASENPIAFLLFAAFVLLYYKEPIVEFIKNNTPSIQSIKDKLGNKSSDINQEISNQQIILKSIVDSYSKQAFVFWTL